MFQNLNKHYIQPMHTFGRDARLFLWMTVINGIIFSGSQIGWSIGPCLFGVMQERYGFTPLFIATTILYLLSIGVMWRYFGYTEQLSLKAAAV
jgi:hypothetical protein